MAGEEESKLARKNRLLATLPSRDYERLLPSLERSALKMRQVIYEPYAPMSHVYFPLDGVVSILTIMTSGKALEVAVVGNEGMAGLPLFLGSDTSPGQSFCQVPGQALRMTAAAFNTAVETSKPLRSVLLRYAQALFTQVSQTAACNGFHNTEQRLSRWLMMTYERAEATEFPVTQDFLAAMLGVRRASVTEVMGVLQEKGVIRYSRGKISFLDPKRLENNACECYRVTADEYQRLLG